MTAIVFSRWVGRATTDQRQESCLFNINVTSDILRLEEDVQPTMDTEIIVIKHSVDFYPRHV